MNSGQQDIIVERALALYRANLGLILGTQYELLRLLGLFP